MLDPDDTHGQKSSMKPLAPTLDFLYFKLKVQRSIESQETNVVLKTCLHQAKRSPDPGILSNFLATRDRTYESIFWR